MSSKLGNKNSDNKNGDKPRMVPRPQTSNTKHSSSKVNHEKIKQTNYGTVTNIYEDFCLVDNVDNNLSIFCQLNLFPRYPKVGDKFYVEAEYNPDQSR